MRQNALTSPSGTPLAPGARRSRNSRSCRAGGSASQQWGQIGASDGRNRSFRGLGERDDGCSRRSGRGGDLRARSVPDITGLLEEIGFYLKHGLWEEAASAIEKCAQQAPNLPQLDSFREQLQARQAAKPPSKPAAPAPVPAVEEPLQPAVAAAAPAGKLSDLALDLEESLGESFAVPPQRAAAAAASAGASAMHAGASPTAQVPPVRGFSMPSTPAPAMHDTDFELAEIFSEFKEGLEQQSGSPTEGEDRRRTTTWG